MNGDLHCPACGRVLPPVGADRRRAFTCSDACHRVWIEDLIARYGETREITHAQTGKVYLVPTRVILEEGIRGADLPRYPEKPGPDDRATPATGRPRGR